LHPDVLALLELERYDDLVVRDGLVLELADLLVADRAVVLLVDEVKVELVLVDRRVDPNGQVDEAEGDRPRPYGAWAGACACHARSIARTRCLQTRSTGFTGCFRTSSLPSATGSRASCGRPGARRRRTRSRASPSRPSRRGRSTSSPGSGSGSSTHFSAPRRS